METRVEIPKEISPKSLHRKTICPIYESIFYYASLFGILPYKFNPDTLEVKSIEWGFSYYLYLFNIVYLVVSMSKVIFLFWLNWWTNFENEDIPGGYFMQLMNITGYTLVFAMMYGYSVKKDDFSSVVSSCIELETDILQGKLV